MPINVLMPALSPTMEKGNLAKWLKKEGDRIKSGDVIAEIETDKATMEVEAVDEGVLAKILVPAGAQDVAVNQLIALIAGEGEDAKAVGLSDPSSALRAPSAAGGEGAKPATASASPTGKAAGTSPSPLAGEGGEGRMRGRGNATAPSPRHSPSAWPRIPASICPASRVPARMAASLRQISRRRKRAA